MGKERLQQGREFFLHVLPKSGRQRGKTNVFCKLVYHFACNFVSSCYDLAIGERARNWWVKSVLQKFIIQTKKEGTEMTHCKENNAIEQMTEAIIRSNN